MSNVSHILTYFEAFDIFHIFWKGLLKVLGELGYAGPTSVNVGT